MKTGEQIISPVTIGCMIAAFVEGDNKKAQIYAEFIAEKYENAGKQRAAKIIRSRADGSYRKQHCVTLDCDSR